MEWSIHELTRLTGTTSRTLRHYGEIGLLRPSRTGAGGIRFYGETELLTLQRILLLRQLGLSLPAIGEILAGSQELTDALDTHLLLLEQEQDRLQRQITSVRRTLKRKRRGESLMAAEMFDGFDHTAHKEEVESRWGKEAYASGDRWWRGMDDASKAAWKQRSAELIADWSAAAERGTAPDSTEAQELARRHVDWLGSVPGSRTGFGGSMKEYVISLGEMYVADSRFAATYGGDEPARFVRDAVTLYAQRHL
ncbi:MerR family transcriptional regulator [Nesterenkonia sp. CF4.4]|uniref:MerR family transcriptional regulator n=1 Tax=Nesterenkonia sp. CF4.4 TaxID=3373079 RepID=UPI003EE5C001